MDRTCIVILNYKNYTDTIQCVESFQKLYPASETYEIVIVDNDSKNESVDNLKSKLENVTLIESTENRGYAAGNNIGLAYAKDKNFDYICILNNDTIILEDFLTPCINKLKEDDSIGIVGPVLLEYDKDDCVQSTGGDIFISKGIVTLKNHHKKRHEIDEVVDCDYVGGACMVFRTSLLELIGFIPENYFLFFEETEWCYSTKVHGLRNICLKNAAIKHKGSVSIKAIGGLQNYLMNRNRVIFVKRNIHSNLRYFIFLIYLFSRESFRLVFHIEKDSSRLTHFVDGVLDRFDVVRFPFLDNNKK